MDSRRLAYLKALEIDVWERRDGSARAAERGLILVDTKYEVGVADDGTMMLIDEIHTPDSSRYWYAEAKRAFPQDPSVPAEIRALREKLGYVPI